MALPHFKNSKSAMSNYEPVYLSLFEVSLTPPTGIDPGLGNANQNLLLEQVKKVSGLDIDKNPGVVEQHYKTAKRRYAGSKPDSTSVDVTIDFEVNLNDANSMFTWKTLRLWNNTVFDPLTGAMGLKKDYTGSGIITMFNRQGDIFRRVRIPVMWPMSNLNAMDLDYQSTEIYNVSCTFAVDYWEDIFL